MFNKKRRIVALCGILSFSLLLGCTRQENPSAQVLLGEAGLFSDVLQLIHAHYVEDAPVDTIVRGALNGALNALDPFSNYFDAKDYKTLKEMLEGEFGGIGAEVKLTNESLEIIAPLDNGPAFKAGLRQGDHIIAINKIPVAQLKPIETLQHIHGKVGESVTLTILRAQEEKRDVVVKREIIQDMPIKSHLEGKIAYFRISSFNNNTAKNLKEAAQNLYKDFNEKYPSQGHFQGVIIDLRNNPGGTLEQAILVTSLFLDKGAIVNVVGKDPEMNRTLHSQGKDLFKDIPTVVLINQGSASASEVFAGALRDHKRAILIGEKTYGKGSVQRIFDLGDKGAVKLTIAYFTTPDGYLINKKGLEPDILVTNTVEGEKAPLLKGSLSSSSITKKNGAHGESKSTGDGEKIPVDLQKQRAIDLLQGLSVLNKW